MNRSRRIAILGGGPAGNGAYRLTVVIALLIAACAYANSLNGRFVWDDNAQIVDNPLIQRPELLGTALTSDVWAFTGAGDGPTTVYWRPMFVAWMAANYALFGLNPIGWHVSTLLLHCGVLVLAGQALRRLQADPAVAAATLWLFAAHPVHTESVAWIAGATDPLLGVFFLGAYVAWLAARRRAGLALRFASWGLFAGATLSKEISVVFPALVFLTEWVLADKQTGARRRALAGLKQCWPFLAIVGLFLVTRFWILGPSTSATETIPRLGMSLVSIPAVLVFYLSQILWPVGLGPVYAFEGVSIDSIGLRSFALPLVVVLAAGSVAALLARRSAVYAVGAAWVALTIAPVLNIGAFPAERLVHDRFVYLASLGMLLLLAGAAFEWLRSVRRLTTKTSRRLLLGVALGLGLVGCVATIRYNRVWKSDLALWEHAARTRPDSAYVLANLGYHYRDAGRMDEARLALERAILIEPRAPRALVDLGLIAVGERKFEQAQQRFRRALEIDPYHESAREQLALVYVSQGRPAEAIDAFDELRRRVPRLRARSTINIAVLLEQLERPDLALAELEALAPDLERATDPTLLRGFWQLGELYRKEGRAREARKAYESFLGKTEGLATPMIDELRRKATRRLARLDRRPPP